MGWFKHNTVYLFKQYIDKDENTNSLNSLESLEQKVLILSILAEGVPAI